MLEIINALLKILEEPPDNTTIILVSDHKKMLFETIISRCQSVEIPPLADEYILKWLPVGTHDWKKFIKPEELEKMLYEKNFSTIDICGLEFNPLIQKWKRSNNLSVNYIICSTKN